MNLHLQKRFANVFGVDFDQKNDIKIVKSIKKGQFNDAWLANANTHLKKAQKVPTQDKDGKDLSRFAQLRAKVKIFFTTHLSVLGKGIALLFPCENR